MLEQVLDFIHNYFIKEVHTGEYTISGGVLNVDFLQENQYYKIVGSVFNDGVYKHTSAPISQSNPSSLVDEVFVGEIWAMAVPPAVIAITNEITVWVAKYGEAMNSPYQSESFGGYSYVKGSGDASGNNRNNPDDWRKIFGSRLNHWRKIS